jgi:hypothetical protein
MAEVCHIRHEADLSEYSSTVTDSGDLSAHADAAMGDTAMGLKLVIDDQTEIYGRKNLTGALTQLRFRFYLDPNGITIGNTNEWSVCNWYCGSGNLVAVVYLGYTTANGYRILVGFEDDESAWDLWLSYVNITDAVHYIEVHVVAESGAGQDDGTAELWIDGVSKDTLGSMDNYGLFSNGLSDVFFGALWNVPASANGTYYLDELRANDDGSEIGPVTHVRRFDHQYRLRRAV